MVTPSEILNRKVAFFSGYERESQNISIDKNNIFSVQFCSSVIEAEHFSIPAAASGTKASPKSKTKIKCYGKSDKCNRLCINCSVIYWPRTLCISQEVRVSCFQGNFQLASSIYKNLEPQLTFTLDRCDCWLFCWPDTSTHMESSQLIIVNGV